MSYGFRKAVREAVGLLIGVAGASGSGKTFSAMRLASGIVGPNERFAVIDTEARRALHYADRFNFDICDLHPPFRPASYAEAIIAADKAGYKVIVVDSMSHEWVSEGGVLDWQEEELTRMAGNDWQKREACKMAAWIKPKQEHKKMVSKLLQVKATLILCFRAEEKVKMEKQKDGNGREKTVIVPIGWQPICEKNLPYELTVSFLLTPDRPGMPQPLKLQEQHKALFPLDKEINEESGKLVAAWAKGGATPTPSSQPPAEEKPAEPQQPPAQETGKETVQQMLSRELSAFCTRWEADPETVMKNISEWQGSHKTLADIPGLNDKRAWAILNNLRKMDAENEEGTTGKLI